MSFGNLYGVHQHHISHSLLFPQKTLNMLIQLDLTNSCGFSLNDPHDWIEIPQTK